MLDELHEVFRIIQLRCWDTLPGYLQDGWFYFSNALKEVSYRGSHMSAFDIDGLDSSCRIYIRTLILLGYIELSDLNGFTLPTPPPTDSDSEMYDEDDKGTIL